MRFLVVAMVVAGSLATSSEESRAACSCTCVNGQVQALCSSALDLEPICAPQICPIVPPSIAPLQSPMVPPVGTYGCRQVQALNRYTGQYEWRTVCQ
jgi:hypothetical protein